MKAKKFLSVSLILVLLFALTGCCGEQITATIEGDGNCSTTIRYLYETSFYEMAKSSGDTDSTSFLFTGDWKESSEKIGNFTYQVFEQTFSFRSYEELSKFLSDTDVYRAELKKDSFKPSAYDTVESALFSSVRITDNLFYAIPSNNSSDSSKYMAGGATSATDEITDYNKYMQDEMGMRMDYEITMPNAIVNSNGEASGNRVTWHLDTIPVDTILIAECEGSNILASDTTPPVISGVKNGGLYKKYRTVKASDDVCLKTLTVDGVKLGGTGKIISAHGKHTVVATDANNNVTTVKFTLDTKKPVIKGVINGKTYKKKVTLKFIDKTAGIKKITVNKKKIKTCKSKTFKKNGKYTVKVTDNAGNVRTVKFKIQK